MAKEPLCGNQPANLSLVIAVFRFPSYFAVSAITIAKAAIQEADRESKK